MWVAVALPGRQEVIEVDLADGATVGEALAAARIAERFGPLDPGSARVGVWARACGLETRLRDGDRVELYRPLKVDAKAMRRERARLKASSTRTGGGR